ncbi:MAG: serine O-acetyltransferase EpsC [Trueperaceae bacterium]|nr:serine O-acetyltransferase EpsC [Trueperaceae bacterium]
MTDARHPNDAPTGQAPEDDALDAFLRARYRAQSEARPCPSRIEVAGWWMDLVGLIIPEWATWQPSEEADFLAHADGVRARTAELVETCDPDRNAAEQVARDLHRALPTLHARLEEDAAAIVAGDPAAHDRVEVVRTYPGFRAMAAYRVAHWLHGAGACLMARMISSEAHRATAIDIHPAAKIGRRFCIDHGTGVVIGETTEVGNDVKIYQGVTLGGLSVRKEDARTKRHPTVEDRVVIYAGATVLGGDTVIGAGSVIGGNVFLTRSVPPGSRVAFRPRMQETAPNGERGEV